MIGQPGRHRRTVFLPWPTLVANPKGSDRPAKVVAEVAERSRRSVKIPVLRKAVRLPNLAAASIPIRSVMSLHEAGVHTPTHRRGRQCRRHRLRRPEHDPRAHRHHPVNRATGEPAAGCRTRSTPSIRVPTPTPSPGCTGTRTRTTRSSTDVPRKCYPGNDR